MSNILLSVVLPTFNERDNIIVLVDRIKRALSSDLDFEIIFVDDSTDDTKDLITLESLKDSRVKLIRRNQEDRTGLATAIVRGIQEAQGLYVACLDSDLQHPPEAIPILFKKAILENAHIVIGARYVSGGDSAGLSGIYRRIISIFTKYFIQIIFIPTRLTTDPGSGFFLFRKNILAPGGGIVLRPTGFKILIEILMRGIYDPAKVFDVPYKFQSREFGSSKASFNQGISFIKHVIVLFYSVPEAGRFIKFCIVGGTGVIINLGTLYILSDIFHINQDVAWFISILVSVFNNYKLNSIFTYNDKKSSSYKESMYRMFMYYTLSFVTLLFNFLIFKVGIHVGLYYLISALLGILLSTILNFILLTKIIWGNKFVNVSS